MRITPLKYLQTSNCSYNKCEQKPASNACQNNVAFPAFQSKYVPVKSIHEAKDFAVRNLGITQFEINNIEVVNWLNKGLLYVKEITHGKTTILDKVVYTDYTDPNNSRENPIAIFQCETYKNTLSSQPHIINDTLIINKRFVKNINKYLDAGIDNLLNMNILTETSSGLKLACNYTTKYKNKFEHLLNQNYRNLSFEDKMGLDNFLTSMQDYFEFKISDIDYYADKFLKYYSNKIPNIYAYSLKHLDGVNKFVLLNKLEQKTGVVHNVNVDGKYKAVLHEIGHMLHIHESFDLFLDKNKRLEKYFRNHLYTASKISQYAQKSPTEFVAETFVKIALKMKLPDDVMNLYKICGGYVI